MPSISGMTPTQAALGQTNIAGSITGQNLTGVTSVNLGPSIQIVRFESASASEITIVFSVGRDAQPGTRTITVTTTAGTATSAAIFTVQNNQVPIASFTIDPRTGTKNVDVTFDASGSSDQGGKINKYEWDLGDGAIGVGKILTHKYTKVGTFDVELTVTDNQNVSNRSRKSIEIENNIGPVAKFTVTPTSGDTNTKFTFDASGSDDKDGRVVRYFWNFDDGETAEGRVVKHTFSKAKTFTVVLTITDNDTAESVRERDVPVEKADGGGGGGGGGCKATLDAESACSGGFVGQSFCVVSVSGNTMITSTNLQRCPGKCGEVRRNADGIREFVGDIDRIDGTRVTLDYGRLPGTTRPKPGEKLKAIWRPCN
jgi:PKD repeat protein